MKINISWIFEVQISQKLAVRVWNAITLSIAQFRIISRLKNTYNFILPYMKYVQMYTLNKVFTLRTKLPN